MDSKIGCVKFKTFTHPLSFALILIRASNSLERKRECLGTVDVFLLEFFLRHDENHDGANEIEGGKKQEEQNWNNQKETHSANNHESKAIESSLLLAEICEMQSVQTT